MVASGFLFLPASRGANSQILSWNNLGMHCMDSDYSVFSILPPYNTIEAQLIVGGLLVTNGNGYTLTYQAVADPTGSFNSTSVGKGNFYNFALPLYGTNLPVNAGLAGWGMPGAGNPPQGMLFEQLNQPVPGVFTPVNWWRAEGIPLTPYDDALQKNPYPLMLLVARDAGNNIIATNQIVLPISDEMDCRACHASGTPSVAEPQAGWVWDGFPERDFRLNILRLHDERQFSQFPGLYQAALASRGFDPQGLYRNVTADGKPVLCAACHADVALGILNSFSNIPPFTISMHGFHAHVTDPTSNTTLDNLANRSACYRCHPGSTTRCLRGAMGGAIAPDGSMEMQCQSCHGNMSALGAPDHVGWLTEPVCQSCHSGTATTNNGQIRYTSVFTDPPTNSIVRVPVDTTFATVSNVPAAGISLYRFSIGHGGLQCEACHGSTHAEFPSTHLNDNLRNIQLQGHAGMMIECTACHVTMPNTANGGPHGMHALGQNWVGAHPDAINSLPGGVTACAVCHGTDYRGTVLSRAQANRTLTANFDTNSFTITLDRGAQIGCYLCHNGPGNDNPNNSAPPTVSNVSTNTTNNKAVAMILPVTGSGLTFRIISQATNGSVGLSNNVAVYFPNPGYVGPDAFTFAAYNGQKNSSLGTGTVSVAQGPFSISAVGYVPPTYPADWPVPFAVVTAISNNAAPVTYDWNFGDNTPHSTNQFPTHTYFAPGTNIWTVIATVSGKGSVDAGLIVVGNPVQLNIARVGSSVTVSWPNTIADTLLEGNGSLASSASWGWVTNVPNASPNLLSVSLPVSGNEFFRVRRPW